MPQSPNQNIPSTQYNRQDDFLNNGSGQMPPITVDPNSFAQPYHSPLGGGGGEGTPLDSKGVLDGIFSNLPATAKQANPFMSSTELNQPVKTALEQTRRYDDPLLGYDPFNPNIENLYGDNQSWYSKLTNSTLKIGANILGGFAQTLGTIPSVVTGLAEGDLSKISNNAFNNSISEWLEGLDNALPNYQTTFSHTHPALSWFNPFQLGSMIDKVGGLGQTMGYLTGSVAAAALQDFLIGMATGGVGEAALIEPQINMIMSRLGKILTSGEATETLTSALANGVKVEQAVDKAFKATKALDKFRYHLNVLTTGVGGAMLSANNTYRHLMQEQEAKFYDLHRRDATQEEKATLESNARGASNEVFLFDSALFSYVNAQTLGTLFKSTAAAKKAVQEELTAGLKLSVKGIDEVEAVAAKEVTGWKKFIPFQDGKTVSRGLKASSLQTLEMAAATTNETATKDWYLRKLDSEAYTEANTKLKSLVRGLEQTFTTAEGFDGLVTGMLMGPLMHAGRNAVERSRGIENSPATLRDLTLNTLNGFKLSDVLGGLHDEVVVSEHNARQMEEALKKDDLFRYKNFKFQELFNFVESGLRAGRHEVRMEQLERLKDLPKTEFEQLFGMRFNEANQQTVAGFVDAMQAKAAHIKQSIEKVQSAFPNPYHRTKDPLNYAGFNEYQTQLALEFVARTDYMRRDALLKAEMTTLFPHVDMDRVTDLASETGLERTKTELKERVKQLDQELKVLDQGGDPKMRRMTKLEREYLQNKLAYFESIHAFEKMKKAGAGYDKEEIRSAGPEKGKDEYVHLNADHPERFSERDFVREAGDLMNYWAGGMEGGEQVVHPADLHDILAKAKDRARLISEANKSLYYYQQLSGKSGWTEYQRDFGKRLHEQLTARKAQAAKLAEQIANPAAAPTGEVVEIDQNGNPKAPEPPAAPKVEVKGATSAEVKKAEEKVQEIKKEIEKKTAAKQDDVQKGVDSKVSVKIDKTGNTGINPATGETGLEPAAAALEKAGKEAEAKHEAEKTALETKLKAAEEELARAKEEAAKAPAVIPAEVSSQEVELNLPDLSEQQQVDKDVKQAVDQALGGGERKWSFNPVAWLQRVFSPNDRKHGSDERKNFVAAISKYTPAELYGKMTLRVQESTQGQKKGEIKKSKFHGNMYYDGYQHDLNLVVDGKVIGKIPPPERVSFKRGEVHLPLWELTREEYVAATGNKADTYEDFMKHVTDSRAVYDAVMDLYKNGKKELTNEELRRIMDFKLWYGGVYHTVSEGASTLIKDLKYRTKGDAVLSLPVIWNEQRKAFERGEVSILNETELSVEDRAKVWEFITQNSDQLKGINSRYVYVFQLPDGSYSKSSPVAARPARVDKAVVDKLFSRIQALGDKPSPKELKELNVDLRNGMYVADSNNTKGSKTNMFLSVDNAGNLYFNVVNPHEKYGRAFKVNEAKEAPDFKTMVDRISEKLRIVSASDRALEKLNLKLSLDDFKNNILQDGAGSMAGLEGSLKVSTLPEVFHPDQEFGPGMAVKPAGTVVVDEKSAAPKIAAERPLRRKEPAYTKEEQTYLDTITNQLGKVSYGWTDGIRALLKEGRGKEVIQTINEHFLSNPAEARQVYGTEISEQAMKAIGGRLVSDGRSFQKAMEQIFGLPKDEARAVAEIYRRVAKVWAERNGKEPEDFWNNLLVVKGKEGVGEPALPQGDAAAIKIMEDGKAIIYALTNPNVSSPLHELAHYYEMTALNAEEKAKVTQWAGHAEWGVATSEKFARGFERYLADGKTDVPYLKSVFEQFKRWLTEIYKGLTGSKIDLELNAEMRNIYRTMLGEKGMEREAKRAVVEAKKAAAEPREKKVVATKSAPKTEPVVNVPVPEIAKVPESKPVKETKVEEKPKKEFPVKDHYTEGDAQEVVDAWKAGEVSAVDADAKLMEMLTSNVELIDNESLYEQIQAIKEVAAEQPKQPASELNEQPQQPAPEVAPEVTEAQPAAGGPKVAEPGPKEEVLQTAVQPQGPAQEVAYPQLEENDIKVMTVAGDPNTKQMKYKGEVIGEIKYSAEDGIWSWGDEVLGLNPATARKEFLRLFNEKNKPVEAVKEELTPEAKQKKIGELRTEMDKLEKQLEGAQERKGRTVKNKGLYGEESALEIEQAKLEGLARTNDEEGKLAQKELKGVTRELEKVREKIEAAHERMSEITDELYDLQGEEITPDERAKELADERPMDDEPFMVHPEPFKIGDIVEFNYKNYEVFADFPMASGRTVYDLVPLGGGDIITDIPHERVQLPKPSDELAEIKASRDSKKFKPNEEGIDYRELEKKNREESRMGVNDETFDGSPKFKVGDSVYFNGAEYEIEKIKTTKPSEEKLAAMQKKYKAATGLNANFDPTTFSTQRLLVLKDKQGNILEVEANSAEVKKGKSKEITDKVNDFSVLRMIHDDKSGHFESTEGMKYVLNRLQQRFGIKYEVINDSTGNWKGRFAEGKVWINEAHLDKTTPFHEYLHPFVEVLKRDNQELYEALKTEFQVLGREGDVLARKVALEVAGDPHYSKLAGDEKIDEALVRYISELSAQNVNKEGKVITPQFKRAMMGLLKKFKTWLLDIWQGLRYHEGGANLRRMDLGKYDTESLVEEAKQNGGVKRISFLHSKVGSDGKGGYKGNELLEKATLQDIADLVSVTNIHFNLAPHMDYLRQMNVLSTVSARTNEGLFKELEAKTAQLEETVKKRYVSQEVLDEVVSLKRALREKDEFLSLNNYLRHTVSAAEWGYKEFNKITQNLKDPEKYKDLSKKDFDEMAHKLNVIKQVFAFANENGRQIRRLLVREDKIEESRNDRALRVLDAADDAARQLHARSVDLTAEWLYPYIDKINQNIKERYPEYVVSKEDFKKKIWAADKDIDRMFFLLGAIGSSKDPISAIVRDALFDVHEQNHLHEAKTREGILSEYDAFLKKNGLKNERDVTENYYRDNYLRKAAVLEKTGEDAEGKPVYGYVERTALHQKYFYDLWHREYADYMESLGERPDFYEDRPAYDAWVEKLENWQKSNGTENAPAERFRNPVYEKLVAEDSFFRELSKHYEEGNAKLASDERLPFGMVPQVSLGKGLFSDISWTKEGLRGKVKEMGEKLLPTAEEGFNVELKNLDGSTYQKVPIAYLRRLEEKDLDLALPETILKFAGATDLNQRMRVAEPNVSLLRNLLTGDSKYIHEARRVNHVTKKLDVHFGRFKTGKERTLVNEQLRAFVDDVVYGEETVHDSISILGKEIDLNRLGNNLSFLTALNNMAGNFTAALNNVMIGNIQTLGESVGAAYYKPEHYKKAIGQYGAALPDFFADTSRLHKSKITLMGIKYDAIQGEFRDKFGKRIVGGVAKRYASTDTLFVLTHAGEHQIQITGMLSLMNATKVKLKDGSEISLFDAHEIGKDGHLKLKNGVVWTPQDEFQFTKKLHALNKRLNGNYSTFDKAYIQRRWYGKMALVYKKYLYNSWAARWGSKKLDYELGDVTEGYYRGFLSKLVSDIRTYKLDAARRMFTREGWSEEQKYAMNKTLYEVGVFVSAALIGTALGGLTAKDDETSWGQDYLGLMMMRVQNDMGAYSIFAPKQLFEIIHNPSAVLQGLERYGNILVQLYKDPFAHYQRQTGAFGKGDSILWAKTMKAVPFLRHGINLLSPKEQQAYYTLTGKTTH